jgi:hypothetical protein
MRINKLVFAWMSAGKLPCNAVYCYGPAAYCLRSPDLGA